MILLGKYLRSFGKRRAIRSYTRQLPRLLAKDYGFSRTYTARQVRRTVERSGLNVYYSCYAIAMFSDRDAFNQFHHEISENCNYDMMRAEIADGHFHGDIHFTISDICAVSSDAGFDPGHGGLHGVGSGDGHGGDGGHSNH
jgi:hypothetical protein